MMLHAYGETCTKIFVDNLLLSQAFVPNRAAPLPCSTESQPWTQEFEIDKRYLKKNHIKKGISDKQDIFLVYSKYYIGHDKSYFLFI